MRASAALAAAIVSALLLTGCSASVERDARYESAAELGKAVEDSKAVDDFRCRWTDTYPDAGMERVNCYPTDLLDDQGEPDPRYVTGTSNDNGEVWLDDAKFAEQASERRATIPYWTTCAGYVIGPNWIFMGDIETIRGVQSKLGGELLQGQTADERCPDYGK